MNPELQAWMDLVPWIVGGIVAFTATIAFATIHSTRMKIKNGYPLEGMWGQSLKPDLTTESMERVKLLTQENAALRAEVSAMKERLGNVERIVTDSGFQLSHQIDRLREGEEIN